VQAIHDDDELQWEIEARLASHWNQHKGGYKAQTGMLLARQLKQIGSTTQYPQSMISKQNSNIVIH
jgi:hypothetical protein